MARKERPAVSGRYALNQVLAGQSLRNIRVPLSVLIVLQGAQLFFYLGQDGSVYDTWQLLTAKAAAVFMCALYLLAAKVCDKKESFLKLTPYAWVLVIVISLLSWSVLNTLIAQSITSDISIYLLVVFTSVAVVRISPKVMFPILGIHYLLFAVGLNWFQPVAAYRTSHVMNGLILTVVAGMISRMFYAHSITDYMDKKFIRDKNQELEFWASHDGLTGLYNRQAVQKMLEDCTSNSERTGQDLSLIMIDLDEFKEINDTFGHITGDAVLKEVADVICRFIRSADIAGRYGGDEFIIILPETGMQAAEDVARRLQAEFGRILVRGCKVSASTGVACRLDESASQLMDKADQYMYKVKKAGKNSLYVGV